VTIMRNGQVISGPVLVGCLVLWGMGLSVPAQTGKWKFLVYGDTRGDGVPINTNILRELAYATTNESPAFVLVPGDLVNSGGLSYFQGWTNLMSPVYQAGIGVYPVMGNHDANAVSAWQSVFGPQIPDNGPALELDRTFFLIYSNALVLAFDNYAGGQPINLPWMNAVLATNLQLHVFAMGHQPAFKANHSDCLDDYPATRDAFWNTLSNVQARAYFCGHDHFFDHIRADDSDGDPANDVHQFIAGGGGAPLYASYAYDGVNSIWSPVGVMHDMTNGYLRVEMENRKVTMTYVHRTTPGNYVDTSDVFAYSLQPRLSWSSTGGVLSLSWRGGGALQASANVDGNFADVPDAASPCVVTNLTEARQFFRVRQP